MRMGNRYFDPKATAGLCQPLITLMPPHSVYLETHLGGDAIMQRKPAALLTSLPCAVMLFAVNSATRLQSPRRHQHRTQRHAAMMIEKPAQNNPDNPNQDEGASSYKTGLSGSKQQELKQDRMERYSRYAGMITRLQGTFKNQRCPLSMSL